MILKVKRKYNVKNKKKIKENDLCIYSFDNDNKTECLVKVKSVTDEIARVKILHVFNDDSGNDFFIYAENEGFLYNASLKYLRKIERVWFKYAND